MPKFTYDEATIRYTAHYRHTDREPHPITGLPYMKTYEPISICTSSEMDRIFAASDTWDEVLEKMHAMVGTPGPKLAKGKQEELPLPDPRKRPMTVFASKLIGGHNALMAGRCPTCGEEIGTFRDALSRKEYGISGMCQKCQDMVFGNGDK